MEMREKKDPLRGHIYRWLIEAIESAHVHIGYARFRMHEV